LAYFSDESGTNHVYVRAFPDKSGRGQISSGGGALPIFAWNGKDLFFYDVPADRIMVASYMAKGDAFVAEEPRLWSNYSIALALSGGVAAECVSGRREASRRRLCFSATRLRPRDLHGELR
jgi:hypothetical protein